MPIDCEKALKYCKNTRTYQGRVFIPDDHIKLISKYYQGANINISFDVSENEEDSESDCQVKRRKRRRKKHKRKAKRKSSSCCCKCRSSCGRSKCRKPPSDCCCTVVDPHNERNKCSLSAKTPQRCCATCLCGDVLPANPSEPAKIQNAKEPDVENSEPQPIVQTPPSQILKRNDESFQKKNRQQEYSSAHLSKNRPTGLIEDDQTYKKYWYRRSQLENVEPHCNSDVSVDNVPKTPRQRRNSGLCLGCSEPLCFKCNYVVNECTCAKPNFVICSQCQSRMAAASSKPCGWNANVGSHVDWQLLLPILSSLQSKPNENRSCVC